MKEMLYGMTLIKLKNYLNELLFYNIMENITVDLLNNIKDFVFFKPKTEQELQEAVNLWCENKEEALSIYGHISNWNTILITNMDSLFQEAYDFNDNINNWNVANVISMDRMFNGASNFNQPLEKWDVSKVNIMSNMFRGAT